MKLHEVSGRGDSKDTPDAEFTGVSDSGGIHRALVASLMCDWIIIDFDSLGQEALERYSELKKTLAPLATSKKLSGVDKHSFSMTVGSSEELKRVFDVMESMYGKDDWPWELYISNWNYDK